MIRVVHLGALKSNGMIDSGDAKPDLDYRAAYTTLFVNKTVGMK